MTAKRLLIVSALFMVVALACSRASALDSSYSVSADYIYFNIDKKTLSCNGRVTLSYGDLRVYADTMRVDVKSDLLEAEGEVRVLSVAPPAPAAAPAEKDAVVEDTDNLKKEVDKAQSGDARAVYGDFLEYDLYYLHGKMLQTGSAVKRVYFKGLDVVQSEAIPDMRKGEYFDDVDNEPMTSLTARKIRVSPFSKYEAWKATLYVKGGKTMSLPYYTNDNGKFTPGNWRLRRARYSSNDNLTLGVGIRYGEKQGRKGFFSLDYRDKGDAHFVLGLDQELHFGRTIGGALNLMNIGGDDSVMSLTLNRYKGMRSHSMNMRFAMDGANNINYNVGDKWGHSSVRGYVSSNWNYKENAQGTLSANVSVTPESRYLDKRKKLSANYDMGASYDDYGYSEPRINTFVSVGVNRSSWSVGPKGMVSANVSTGASANSDGKQRANIGAGVSYNLSVGRGGFFQMGYRNSYVTESDGEGGGGNQMVSTSFGIGSGRKWSTRLSTSYSLTTDKLSSMSGMLDFNLNKKSRFSTSAAYDFAESKFISSVFNLSYKLYASNVGLHWYKQTNDFVVDFWSQFR